MSQVGRRSEFSREMSHLRHHALDKIDAQEIYDGIVLDICGAHKPKTRFLPDLNLEKGIWFVVAIKQLQAVYPICWQQSYEELRMLHGTDLNITGKPCTIFSASKRKDSIKYSRIELDTIKTTKYQNEYENTFHSLGSMYSICSNYEAMMNSFKQPDDQSPGAAWKPFK